MSTPVLSSQVGGRHYVDAAYQPIIFITKLRLSFCQGCIVKYVSRHMRKNGKEDLEKAMHYCKLAKKYSDKSYFVESLLRLKRSSVFDEIDCYVESNNMDLLTKACIARTVCGDFDTAHSILEHMVSSTYNK